jgi:hypothetical protein
MQTLVCPTLQMKFQPPQYHPQTHPVAGDFSLTYGYGIQFHGNAMLNNRKTQRGESTV